MTNEQMTAGVYTHTHTHKVTSLLPLRRKAVQHGTDINACPASGSKNNNWIGYDSFRRFGERRSGRDTESPVCKQQHCTNNKPNIICTLPRCRRQNWQQNHRFILGGSYQLGRIHRVTGKYKLFPDNLLHGRRVAYREAVSLCG